MHFSLTQRPECDFYHWSLLLCWEFSVFLSPALDGVWGKLFSPSWVQPLLPRCFHVNGNLALPRGTAVWVGGVFSRALAERGWPCSQTFSDLEIPHHPGLLHCIWTAFWRNRSLLSLWFWIQGKTLLFTTFTGSILFLLKLPLHWWGTVKGDLGRLNSHLCSFRALLHCLNYVSGRLTATFAVPQGKQGWCETCTHWNR